MSQQEKFRNQILSAFEDAPVEDGMTHPAENIITEQLKSTKERFVLDWLEDFSLDTEYPCFAASTLRCLGRQEPPPGTITWRTDLIRDALSINDLEVQDAAAASSGVLG